MAQSNHVAELWRAEEDVPDSPTSLLSSPWRHDPHDFAAWDCADAFAAPAAAAATTCPVPGIAAGAGQAFFESACSLSRQCVNAAEHRVPSGGGTGGEHEHEQGELWHFAHFTDEQPAAPAAATAATRQAGREGSKARGKCTAREASTARKRKAAEHRSTVGQQRAARRRCDPDAARSPGSSLASGSPASSGMSVGMSLGASGCVPLPAAPAGPAPRARVRDTPARNQSHIAAVQNMRSTHEALVQQVAQQTQAIEQLHAQLSCFVLGTFLSATHHCGADSVMATLVAGTTTTTSDSGAGAMAASPSAPSQSVPELYPSQSVPELYPRVRGSPLPEHDQAGKLGLGGRRQGHGNSSSSGSGCFGLLAALQVPLPARDGAAGPFDCVPTTVLDQRQQQQQAVFETLRDRLTAAIDAVLSMGVPDFCQQVLQSVEGVLCCASDLQDMHGLLDQIEKLPSQAIRHVVLSINDTVCRSWPHLYRPVPPSHCGGSPSAPLPAAMTPCV